MTHQELKEELREEFEELFPKDDSASMGGERSKSNRSAGLVLWAKFEIILDHAVKEERNRIKVIIEEMPRKHPEYESDMYDQGYSVAIDDILSIIEKN